jgi:hypothetical protein
MRKVALGIGIGIIGLGLIWLGGQIGWWWITPLVGGVIGIVLRPVWLALVVALAVGGLGWGLPLALLAASAPVGQVASAVESVIGLTATGGLVIMLATVLLGCILSGVGAWVGIAGKRLFPRHGVERA